MSPNESTPRAIDPWSTARRGSKGGFARFLRKVIPKRFRPIGYLEHLVRSRTGDRVANGPFEGTRYVAGATNSAYVPKLLGIYERELNGPIEEACALGFHLIVDIGAAEGYYAIGLARRNPRSRMIAFEMDSGGQECLREMSALNGVSSQIEIRGKCDKAELRGTLLNAGQALVVCDVEGDEDMLLQPKEVPELLSAFILVEMHDFIVPGISERMIQRFLPTHEILRIWQEPRGRTDLPWRTIGTALLPQKYLAWAVSEWRPVQMSWLWMKPLTAGTESLRLTNASVNTNRVGQAGQPKS